MAKEKFTDNQSYKHRYAVNLLTGWLQDEEQKHESCSFCGFAWRRNYGVFPELKFYETSHPFYFEQGENSGRISFVPDITIFHCGMPLYLIEVVHRHPPSIEKLFKIHEFFYPWTVEIITISADAIVNNVAIPSYLNYSKAA